VKWSGGPGTPDEEDVVEIEEDEAAFVREVVEGTERKSLKVYEDRQRSSRCVRIDRR